MAFIGFQNNKIKYVGANLLENLEKLKRANFQENVCINKFAIDGSEMEKLIEELKKKCKALENSTTEKPEIATQTFNDSTEFNLEEENLKIENQILKSNLEKLGEKFNDIKEIFGEIFDNFNSRLNNLEDKMQNCTCGWMKQF